MTFCVDAFDFYPPGLTFYPTWVLLNKDSYYNDKLLSV